MLFGFRIFGCGPACFPIGLAGETETRPLPAIFAAPVKREMVIPTFETRTSLVSDRVYRLITSAVLAKGIHSAQPVTAPTGERGLENLGVDPLLMDKVVVHSSPVREFTLAKPVSSLDKFRRRGILYESVGKTFTFDTLFYVDRWYSNRQGSGGIETRVELKFNFRW